MFWKLLLAHFAGDFLLQSDWMVQNRDKFWVLSAHAGTHLGLMLILAGESRSSIWPYITLLALTHMGQDAFKIYLVRKKPGWSAVAFTVDQGLHFLILLAIFKWAQTGAGVIHIDQTPAWVMIAIAYLFITSVWFISERTFYQGDPDYVQHLNSTKYSRMLTRAGFVSAFMLVRTWVFTGFVLGLSNPYPSSNYRQRAMLTDFIVSVVVMVFLYLALGSLLS